VKSENPEPLRVASYRFVDGLLHVTFKTIAGRAYRIQMATELESPNWTDLSLNILATGATTLWSGPLDDVENRYFFRVIQVD
jgi:hypothetical protein